MEKTLEVVKVQQVDKSAVGIKVSHKIERQKEELAPKVEDGSKERANGNRTELKEAVDKMNKTLEIFNVERRFVIDDRTHEVVVKIIDKETGEVIDQIPPEEALKRYYEMQKFIGLIFNRRV